MEGRSRSLAVIALMLTPGACKSYAEQRTPVEVWRVGDDGLTIKFSDALESAFKASLLFRLSSGNKPGTLIVAIPTNVDWKRMGIQTLVRYSVKFLSGDQRSIGSSTGVCWEAALQNCAARVVRQAIIAATKMNRNAASSGARR